MGKHVQPAPGAPWYKHAWKLGVALASAGSALVSLVSALYSYGVIGHAQAHETIANIGAAWVGLRPATDTATALGDTLHLAATVTDANGSVLVGTRPTWVSDDPRVAMVLPNGSVIARGPGATTIAAVVGAVVARARVVVAQRVASLAVEATPGDSIALPEGGAVPLRAVARDARRHRVAGLAARWRIDDTAVAVIDSAGLLSARRAGRAQVTASVAGLTARAPVTILPTPAAIAAVAGVGQHALAGATLPRDVVVRVTSRTGQPVPGAPVTFRLIDGQGTVQPDTARTDADGRARADWTLGPLPGRQKLLASVPSVDSALAIVAESDPVARDTRVTATDDHVSGIAGETLADPVTVRLADTTGRALADVPVTWTTLDGGAVRALDTRTDSLGEARAQWTLAPRAGRQRVRAQVGAGAHGYGIAPVTIVARALPGRPASLDVVSGDRQHGTAGELLRKAVVLRVEDAHGNRVPDVVLVVRPSDGSVPDSAPRTDSSGIARLRWTLGHRPGHHRLLVRMEGTRQHLDVAAEASPGAPARLTLDIAHGSRASRRRLVARVTDAFGNPVPHARLRFSAHSGHVSPERASTGDDGRATVTWTPGKHAGEQSLRGAVLGSDVTDAYVVHIGGR